jgi:hypothetical protein
LGGHKGRPYRPQRNPLNDHAEMLGFATLTPIYAGYDYEEAAPHLILQAFLQRVTNGGAQINCLGDAAGTVVIDRLERRHAGLPLNKPEDDQRDIVEVA